jgi:hypothetical protein
VPLYARFFGLPSAQRPSPPPHRGSFGGHGGWADIEALQKNIEGD